MTERRLVAVFGSSATRPGTDHWAEAETVGRRLASAGIGVVTGGYGGTMEAVSRGAAMGGGHVVGVTAPDLFPDRPGANRFVAEESTEPTITGRIGTLTRLASGVIVLAGSIGTVAELAITWNINHLARLSGTKRLPTAAVGAEMRELCSLLVHRMGANPADVHNVDSGDDAVDWILSQPEIQAVGPISH